ncbi:MAG TPA: amidohydrolase family protein [Gemmatimonadaceae bacterium]|jgi:imidazolonepropionase-like amidohydrolase|nr:amidohydrolase family protein [Gemmatimonadaceae bacterium]
MILRTTLAAASILGATALGAMPAPRDSTGPGTGAPEPATPAPGTVAFVNVNVLPMDRDRVLTGQTVIVRDGRITELGPAASVRVPADAQRIDGNGKFLMPGLAEMHAHVLGPQQPQELNRDIMFLYVANGITTIRAMLGAPNQLVLREQLKKGEVLGPTMFVAAPSLNGNSAPNPDTAAKLVRAHKAAGYDLVKLHPGLSRATYDAATAVANEVGITLAGHVSQDVGIDRTLEARQSTVDHLDGYIEGAVPADVKRRMMSPTDTVSFAEWMGAVSEAEMRNLARRTKEAGVWNVPTMFLWENFFGTVALDEVPQREEMKYAPKQWVNNWMNQKRNQMQQQAKAGITADHGQRLIAHRRRMLKILADEGAPLLMGTDSPQMFNVPGFALHRELRVMADAGLTPYQVLESGTKNVGLYAERDLEQDGKFGTVAVGHWADLVLLDGNPLQSLDNITRRAGVMVRGRWVPKSEIDAGLQALATKYAAQ